MVKLSVCIITYNEEKLIKECLENIKEIADEIVIVDSYSGDKTVQICKRYTDKVYFKKFKDDYSNQRNYVLAKATGDWILVIDADEILSKELKGEIKNLINQKDYNGYLIPRRTYYTKTRWFKHGYSYPDYQPRLFRNENAKYKYKVHEWLDIKGKIKKLRIGLDIFHNHYRKDHVLDSYYFRNSILKYARIAAEERKDTLQKHSFLKAIKSFIFTFGDDFFIKRGYLDGFAGLKMALMQSAGKFMIFVYHQPKYIIQETQQRIVRKNIEYAKCGLCGADKPKYLFTAMSFDLVKCKNCGLVYMNPILTKGELNKLYEKEDYGNYLSREKEFKIIFLNRLNTIEKFKKRGKILDVGSGVGFFLNIAKAHNWATYGLEISENLADYSRKRFGLNISFDLTKFSKNYFDVITMWHVLEHIKNPVNFLKRIKPYLKQDGFLFIEVPNFASLSAKRYKERWGYLGVPEHLYQYTPKTLQLILEKANFELVRSIFLSGPEPQNIKSKFKKIHHGIIKKLCLGDRVIVMAKK